MISIHIHQQEYSNKGSYFILFLILFVHICVVVWNLKIWKVNKHENSKIHFFFIFGKMEKICFMLVSWILPVLWDYHWLGPLHLMLTEINYSVFKFLFTVLCSINLSFYFCGVRWRHISYQVLLSQPELWKTISLLSPSQCKYNLIIICFRAVLKLSPMEV